MARPIRWLYQAAYSAYDALAGHFAVIETIHLDSIRKFSTLDLLGMPRVS